MPNYIRSLAFDTLFYIGTFFLLLFTLPLLLGPRRWCVWLSRLWCRCILWTLKHIVGLDYRITGQLPNGPVILASKHQSAWETFMLPLLTYNPVFVLKRELLWIPVFGWYLKKMGMLSVHRNQKGTGLNTLTSETKKIVASGRSLVLFPEGTRTVHGEVPPLKGGVWTLYKILKIPVVPIALDSGRYWSRRTVVKKPGVIRVTIHQPLSGTLKERKAFLKKLHDQINT